MGWPRYLYQARVVKDVKFNTQLKPPQRMWGFRNILCKHDRKRISWNRKHQCLLAVWHFGLLLGGLDVVLDPWGGGGPWLAGRPWFCGFEGLSFVGPCYWVFVILYMVLWRVWRTPPPLKVGASSLVLISLEWLFRLLSPKKLIKIKILWHMTINHRISDFFPPVSKKPVHILL